MACLNCNKDFKEDAKFCSNCGAPTITERLTVKHVFREFSERYLSFDNKFLQTIKTMLVKPELVVNGYLNGLRMRYVNPITYLIIAVTLSGFQMFLIKKGFINFNPGEFIEQDPNIPFSTNEMYNTINEYQSWIIFISIPLLALISKLVFYERKNLNFAEHNLIYFYTYSTSAIITILFFVPFAMFSHTDFMNLSLISGVFMILYHIYALKRIFSLKIKQMTIKTLLFFLITTLIYVVLVVIVGIAFAIYLLSTGKLNA